jgi:rhamnulokinase
MISGIKGLDSGDSMNTFLAIDLGAESGRGVLVTLRNAKVSMEEIHRFPNRPVRLGSTLYWDFPFLFAEIINTLKHCAVQQIKLDAIGVDTWGVDFGLVGADGKLLSCPVHYRDSRTDNIHAYSDPIMSRREIFEATACEPWAISSLFQMLSMQRDKSPVLPAAKTFLNMPDLINYFLTGIKASEKTIVSTANLMGADGNWSADVIKRFGLPNIFGKLVEPATILGPLDGTILEQTALGAVPVVATCGHDTSAVAAAVPAQGDDWAFLSCGTWSILGRLLDEPLTSAAAFDAGFCNEYTLDAWFICRNILGLWLVQELRRKWDTASDRWDYDRMTAEAAKARPVGMFDVEDSCLMAPADMEEAQLNLLAKLNQPTPDSRGELVRCVLESLALEYAYRLNMIDDLTGRKTKTLYMVGGGIANKLLCQLTANAVGRCVYAGADQCTSLGNALTVAVGTKVLNSPENIRQVMRNSFELAQYQPRDSDLWAEKLGKYSQLKKNSNRR